MDKPLLSICIPTYNRCEQLKKTVEALTAEHAFSDGKVEIIISDNASQDDTEAVGRSFDESFERVKYYRNSRNIGNDNFPLVIGRASGVLRKLNNDTLIPIPGALDYLCNIVEKYQAERPVLFFNNGEKKAEEKRITFHEFAVSAGYWITWIGAFSIWEEDCNEIAADTSGAELLLWQVRKTYELAYIKNECVVIDRPIGKTIVLRKKDISYGLYKVFYQNYLTLLKPYVKKGAVTTNEYEMIRKELLYDFFTNWIIRWELEDENMDYSDKENLKEIVFGEYITEPYWNEYSRFYRKRKVIIIIKNYVKSIIGKR